MDDFEKYFGSYTNRHRHLLEDNLDFMVAVMEYMRYKFIESGVPRGLIKSMVDE